MQVIYFHFSNVSSPRVASNYCTYYGCRYSRYFRRNICHTVLCCTFAFIFFEALAGHRCSDIMDGLRDTPPVFLMLTAVVVFVIHT